MAKPTYLIDRATWANADTAFESLLLDSTNGMMCCLGQICAQTGTPRKTLAGRYVPNDLPSTAIHVPELLDETFVSKAMDINDTPAPTRRHRERWLRALFAAKGITLAFVGRSPRKVTRG